MTNVLWLIKGLGRGGAEQLLVDSAPYLDRSKFNYSVAYLLGYKDAFVDDLTRAGIPVYYLAGERGVGWVGRLRRLITKSNISLVHVHSPLASSIARLGLRGSRARLIYTEHNVWDRYRLPTRILNAATYPLNQHVFTVSEKVNHSVRWPMVDRRFLPPIETLYHGLDPAKVERWRSADPRGVRTGLSIDEDTPLIGMVAKFRHQKAHDVLLPAFVKVLEAEPTAHLMLVGSGPLEDRVRKEVARLRLTKSVSLTGSRDDIGNLLSAIDVFVLPSRYEGLPIALLEAMAVGKPCVVTQVSGSIEVAEHEVNALIVPPEDPELLAKAIIRLIREPQLRAEISQAAMKRSADFDIRSAVERYEDVYARLEGT